MKLIFAEDAVDRHPRMDRYSTPDLEGFSIQLSPEELRRILAALSNLPARAQTVMFDFRNHRFNIY